MPPQSIHAHDRYIIGLIVDPVIILMVYDMLDFHRTDKTKEVIGHVE